MLLEGGRAMLPQVALKADGGGKDHPSVPLSTDGLVRDAVACVRAGAGAFHIQARDLRGNERLDPDVVDPVAARVREAGGVPVGVTTGAWIEPDLQRRRPSPRTRGSDRGVDGPPLEKSAMSSGDSCDS
jgi:uncharacterized protein (DUF849 family)